MNVASLCPYCLLLATCEGEKELTNRAAMKVHSHVVNERESSLEGQTPQQQHVDADAISVQVEYECAGDPGHDPGHDPSDPGHHPLESGHRRVVSATLDPHVIDSASPPRPLTEGRRQIPAVTEKESFASRSLRQLGSVIG